jgi:hypothetical protein
MADATGTKYHAGEAMTTTLLVIAGTMLVFAWGFAIVQWKHVSAGYEDEQGFHFGRDPRERDDECVLIPVPVQASDDASLPRAQRGL